MERVLTSVIPSLVKDGVFGSVEYVGLTSDEGKDIGPHFASTLSFLSLTVKRNSGQEVFPLVVKVQTENLWKRENFDLKNEFRNEIAMYTDVLPALGYPPEHCPKFYHGFVAEDGYDDDVVILEDLRHKGFTSSKLKIFLDFDHISLALKKIALLHSKSYILKHENEKKFFGLAGKCKALKMEIMAIDDLELIRRGTDAFTSKYGRDEGIDRFLEVLNAGVKHEMFILADEPFGVICHGDFCNNNVIYRYDENDRPIECEIIDFQRSIYGSPAAELAFFLYLSTTLETREEFWDDVLKIYWDTLRENVPQHIQLPSFEDFLKHFATRAILGYIVCTFFLGMLMYNFDSEDLAKMTTEEQDELARRRKEELDNKLADVLHHALQKKYIHSFVDYIKQMKK